MAEFSKNRHISNLINMSCKVIKQKVHARATTELYWAEIGTDVRFYD